MIRKLQEGGQTYGFLDYVPLISQQPEQPIKKAESSSIKKEEESASLLSKEMVKALMESGLSSDVQSFLNDYSNMFADPLHGNPFGNQLDPAALARQQSLLIGRINQIKNNQITYNSAVDLATKRDAINEYAVTELGRMIVWDGDDKKIKQLTPEEFKLDKHRALTNAELAEMRMNNNSLAFDTNTFNIIGNATSALEVDNIIRTAINEANSMTNENNTFRSAKELSEVKAGLEILKDGTYKEKIKNTTNRDQINSAINYLIQILPNRHKNYLKAVAAANGQDPNSGLVNLLTSYANTKISVDHLRDISYDDSATKDGDKGIKGDTELNPAQLLIKGEGVRNMISINPGSESAEYQLPVTTISTNFTVKDNQPYSVGTLESVMEDTYLGIVGAADAMYIGDQNVSPDMAKTIAIDNRKGINIIYLPATIDNKTGKPKPNFDLMNRIIETENEIEKLGSPNEIEKKQIYAKNGLEDLYGIKSDPTLLYKQGLLKKFYVVNGIAEDRSGFFRQKNFPDNKYTHTLSQEETNEYAEMMKKSINSQLEKGNFDFRSWLVPGSLERLVKTNVYMYAQDDPYAARLVSKNITEPKSRTNIDMIMATEQKAERERSLSSRVQNKDTSADTL